MIVTIVIPASTWIALVYRLMNEGHMDLDDATTAAEHQVRLGGEARIQELLTCDAEKIRSIARGYDILIHGA